MTATQTLQLILPATLDAKNYQRQQQDHWRVQHLENVYNSLINLYLSVYVGR